MEFAVPNELLAVSFFPADFSNFVFLVHIKGVHSELIATLESSQNRPVVDRTLEIDRKEVGVLIPHQIFIREVNDAQLHKGPAFVLHFVESNRRDFGLRVFDRNAEVLFVLGQAESFGDFVLGQVQVHLADDFVARSDADHARVAHDQHPQIAERTEIADFLAWDVVDVDEDAVVALFEVEVDHDSDALFVQREVEVVVFVAFEGFEPN
jgi:hypothetical protein